MYHAFLKQFSRDSHRANFGERNYLCWSKVTNCKAYWGISQLTLIHPVLYHLYPSPRRKVFFSCSFCCKAAQDLQSIITNAAWRQKCEYRENNNAAIPPEEILVMVIFVSRRKKRPATAFSVLTQRGDYSSFYSDCRCQKCAEE